MNIKEIKVAAVTLATLQALSLSACKNNDKQDTYKIDLGEVTIDNLYVKPYKIFEYDMIVNKDTNIIEESDSIHLKWLIDKGTKVKSLETNGEYTLILVNDNKYYIKSKDISTYIDLNKEDYIKNNKEMICYDTVIYDEYGIIIKKINSTKVMVSESNNEYSHVFIPLLDMYAYIENNNLYNNPMLYKYNYKQIEDTKMYITKDTPIYNEDGITLGYIFAGETCTATSISDEYTYIINSNGIEGFVASNALSNTKESIYRNHKIDEIKEIKRFVLTHYSNLDRFNDEDNIKNNKESIIKLLK